MPYIGNSPGTGTRNRFIYTATASQTTFSGADDNGKTLKYSDSDYVDVYLNGICLVPVTDYTATSKTSVVLIQAASLNDTLEVVAYDIATISDTVSKADGGTFDGNVTFGSGADIITETLGTDNVRIGENAGDSIASGGNQNVVIGKDAGTAITTGDDNVAVGYQALDANTTGTLSVAVGSGALGAQTTGDRNIGVGASAGAAITTGQGSIAIGYQALAAATTGDDNVAIGSDSPTVDAALERNTTGNKNVAVGGGALTYNTTADEGVAVGYEALKTVTTGFGNTAVGGQAGKAVTTTDRSSFLGNLAGSTTTGRANTFLGSDSGYLVTSGATNTILGRFNGNQDNTDIRTSSGNVAISNGSGTVRIFCNSEGYVKHKPVSSTYYAQGGAYHEFSHNNNDTSAIIYYQQHASYVQSVQFTQAQRTASSAYSFAEWRSGAGSDVEFYLRGDGNAYADGSWNGGGADYAEYFEWADGNSSNQDRTGYTVVLDNEKIRLATSDDAAASIIGAVSVNPSVVGDSDIDQWKHKYQRDDFGGFVWETYTVTEWTETVVDQEATDEKEEITREVFHNYESDKIPDGITAPDDATVSTQDADGNTLMRKVLNTDYNPNTAYVSREDRQEWATIGLMGKLRIRKGQPTGDRWIKMRDISDTVEEWLVR